MKTDKRGRPRQIIDSILEGACLENPVSRPINGYAGVDVGGPPRFVSSRLAGPRCLFSLAGASLHSASAELLSADYCLFRPADTDARVHTLAELAPVVLLSAPLPPPTPAPAFLQWGKGSTDRLQSLWTDFALSVWLLTVPPRQHSLLALGRAERELVSSALDATRTTAAEPLGCCGGLSVG